MPHEHESQYDVFISHASEDKDSVVRPLKELLEKQGLSVWLDEERLRVGDSLREAIDGGIRISSYAVIVLSPDFFRKSWPVRELDAFVDSEGHPSRSLLPVWHKVSSSDVKRFSPLIGNLFGASTRHGLEYVAEKIMKAIRGNEATSFEIGIGKPEGTEDQFRQLSVRSGGGKTDKDVTRPEERTRPEDMTKPRFCGRYGLAGVNPIEDEISGYVGQVEVASNGTIYTVTWKVETNDGIQEIAGLGLSRGGILAVSFSGFARREVAAVAVYERLRDGVLRGTWAMAGVAGLGYEELYRLDWD